MRITSGDIPPTAAATLVRALQNSRFFPKEIFSRTFTAKTASRLALESPQPNERVYDQSISISGTIDAPDNREPDQIIRAWIDNICIGETRIFRQIEESRLGYKLLAKLPDPIAEPRSAVIVLTLSGEKETETKRIGEVSVELMPAGLRDRPYGEVVPPEQGKVLHRESIYGSGPPAEQPSPEAVRLILDHLPSQSSIVDVGCGAGAFALELIKAGHKWLGLEQSESLHHLARTRPTSGSKTAKRVSAFSLSRPRI